MIDGNGYLVLNINVIREMKNIKVYIFRGCLLGIFFGCGINRNEWLNKYLNDFLFVNKIIIFMVYVRCFRSFVELSGMKKKDYGVFYFL